MKNQSSLKSLYHDPIMFENIIGVRHLPEVVTHIQCDSDWVSVPVNREPFGYTLALRPIENCVACLGESCDWHEYLYPFKCFNFEWFD